MGQISITAQRVAAVRLGFERVPSKYGNPAADEALARDIADAGPSGVSEPMTRYLHARTAFFDHVVTTGIERGVQQVVVVAAGYDGRALRYAAPNVRWFEIDHPDTQRDKRARLDRLGLDSSGIAFIPADLAVDDIVTALHAAGHHRAMRSLMLCEGLAVYLDIDVLRGLLADLRQVAAPGSVLAISLSVSTGSTTLTENRRLFREAVAALGEPARTTLTADDAQALLTSTGWQPDRPTDPEDRRRRAGLVIARV